MGHFKIDWTDAAVWGLFFMAILTIVGVSTHSLFGVAASDPIFGTLNLVAGIELSLTIAGLAVLLMFGWVLVTNRHDPLPNRKNDDFYKAVVVFGSILTVSMVFIPGIGEWIANQHDIVAIIAALVSTGTLGVIGYMK